MYRNQDDVGQLVVVVSVILLCPCCFFKEFCSTNKNIFAVFSLTDDITIIKSKLNKSNIKEGLQWLLSFNPSNGETNNSLP